MLAPDGLIRLTFEDFRALQMRHYMSWPDADLLDELYGMGVPAKAAGYCEWVSEQRSPQISIGWAWFHPQGGNAVLLAPGGISSNVMFRSETGYDVGSPTTGELLTAWLACVPWQSDVVLDREMRQAARMGGYREARPSI